MRYFFLYCFNFTINRLICGVLFALALLSNLTDIIPSSKVIPSAFRLDALFRQDEITKDFENSQKRGFTGVHFSPVPPIKLAYFNRGEYLRLYADNVHELGQEQEMVLDELNCRTGGIVGRSSSFLSLVRQQQTRSS